MANLNQLVSQAHQVAQDAQGYLERRTADTTKKGEQKRLSVMAGDLHAANAKLKQKTRGGKVVKVRDSTLTLLSEQLELAGRHVQQLHEYDDHAAVESVFGAVHHVLHSLEIVHGAGGGRPKRAETKSKTLWAGPQPGGGGRPGG